MNPAQLEARLKTLETEVAELRRKVTGDSEPWWVTQAGRFANDPVFDEVVRLGREYRESLRPGAKKKAVKKKKAAAKPRRNKADHARP